MDGRRESERGFNVRQVLGFLLPPLQLEPYMDEPFLRAAFAHFGFLVTGFKWIKSHQTGERGLRVRESQGWSCAAGL